MADQLSQPFTILDIGLPSRHVFDMLRIAHNELAGPFQDRIHRLPVDAGALHADLGTALRPEPVPQGHQITGVGGEGPNHLARFGIGSADEQTGRDGGLMDIQTTTAFQNRFHGHLLCDEEALVVPYTMQETAMRPSLKGATQGDAFTRAQVSLSFGVHATAVATTLTRGLLSSH